MLMARQHDCRQQMCHFDSNWFRLILLQNYVFLSRRILRFRSEPMQQTYSKLKVHPLSVVPKSVAIITCLLPTYNIRSPWHSCHIPYFHQDVLLLLITYYSFGMEVKFYCLHFTAIPYTYSTRYLPIMPTSQYYISSTSAHTE